MYKATIQDISVDIKPLKKIVNHSGHLGAWGEARFPFPPPPSLSFPAKLSTPDRILG